MNIWVDALSVNNASGRHVLMGHLKQVTESAPEDCYFTILYNEYNSDIRCDLRNTVWLLCPRYTQNWMWRNLWLMAVLERKMNNERVDWYFSPSGIVPSFKRIKTATLAQNPWCLVPLLRKNRGERLKAWLQRRAYRKTVEKADLMLYNSRYMSEIYHENAGQTAKCFRIVYQGVNQETFDRADLIRKKTNRVEGRILTVSAMASHKNIEAQIRALQEVRKNVLTAHLVVVGAWPDVEYKNYICSLIRKCEVENFVTIYGHVTRVVLDELYASASVFCLMSRCESFGIPAIEAQAFGTPVVTSNCCAVPEICGEGGVYVHPDDTRSLAEELIRVLTDEVVHAEYSERSLENVKRFNWVQCSSPLVKLLDEHLV